MSKWVSLLIAIVTTAVAITMLVVEEEVKPIWTKARAEPLSRLWTARWADMFAHLLLLVAVMVTISHLLSEVRGKWRLSMPTQ